MFRTVTVGLDGSPESLAAAEWAAREATRRELPLRLVTVWEAGADAFTPFADPVAQREWAERLPRRTRETLLARHPDLAVSAERLTGVPGAVLAAATGPFDLLVLGSGALGGVRAFLLGSVSQATIAHADCPVVLIRGTAGRERGGEVVVGVDLPSAPEEVLAFAFDAAARRDAPLRAVHTWSVPPVYGLAPGGVDPAVLEVLAEDRAEELAAALRPWRAKYPLMEVREEAGRGRAAHALLRASDGAALLVVGRRVRPARFGAHIGPVAHAVMHHGDVPLAVVPHA
jgi:nucleotide-binding universal stress UspA family protein